VGTESNPVQIDELLFSGRRQYPRVWLLNGEQKQDFRRRRRRTNLKVENFELDCVVEEVPLGNVQDSEILKHTNEETKHAQDAQGREQFNRNYLYRIFVNLAGKNLHRFRSTEQKRQPNSKIGA